MRPTYCAMSNASSKTKGRGLERVRQVLPVPLGSPPPLLPPLRIVTCCHCYPLPAETRATAASLIRE